MKLSRLIVLLIIASILSAGITFFIYNTFSIESITTIGLDVKVAENFGLNGDTDKIYFGKLMPGSEGSRGITLSNNASYPLKVIIKNDGYISDWVTVSDNHFTLNPHENRKVIYKIIIPLNASFGNYTGISKIEFRKKIW